jgi:hypothetical protein
VWSVVVELEQAGRGRPEAAALIERGQFFLVVDVQPVAAALLRQLDRGGDQRRADPLRWWDGATVVSSRKKWVAPSQATLTNPTSCAPSYAQTQPAECRRSTSGSISAWSGHASSISLLSADPSTGPLVR